MALVAALPLALGIVAAVLTATQLRTAADLRVERSIRESVAAAVSPIRTEVRNELAAAMAGSSGGVQLPTRDLHSGRFSVQVALQARDTATALLDDSARPPSIVAPVYAAASPPATSAARRSELVAYRLVPLTLGQTVDDLAPDGGSLLVRGPLQVVTAVPGAAPAGAHDYSVDMDLTGLPGWRVESWAMPAGLPGVAWFWIIGILAVALAAAVAVAMFTRRYQQLRARDRRYSRDRALVNDLAPVLQNSLDIGEVVPAATSLLADGLSLSGLSLCSPSDTGERQLFGWGTAPSMEVMPSAVTPQRVAPGETFAAALTRGGRVLGVLRVVASTELLNEDLRALSLSAELLGSALANAEAYAQQQELVEQMRSVDELKTVFLSTASHELRTPVAAIVGFSSLLLQHWDSLPAADARSLVERTVANGKRLNLIIEQLLDFSRLERGLVQENDLIDLGATVATILRDQPDIIGDHVLRTDLPGGLMVIGATAALERIVVNLVGNAAKYSPARTMITVGAHRNGDDVLLVVDDEGPGVLPADRERIFSRFYRGSGQLTAQGAGVGLAIVAEYTAAMSGRVGVDTAPGGGARFTVSVPAARSLDEEIRETLDVAVS